MIPSAPRRFGSIVRARIGGLFKEQVGLQKIGWFLDIATVHLMHWIERVTTLMAEFCRKANGVTHGFIATC